MSTCRYKYSGDKIHVVKGQGTNRFTNLIYNWDIFVTRSLSFAACFPNLNQCDLNIENKANLHHFILLPSPTVLAYGTKQTPEMTFQRQFDPQLQSFLSHRCQRWCPLIHKVRLHSKLKKVALFSGFLSRAMTEGGGFQCCNRAQSQSLHMTSLAQLMSSDFLLLRSGVQNIVWDPQIAVRTLKRVQPVLKDKSLQNKLRYFSIIVYPRRDKPAK